MTLYRTRKALYAAVWREDVAPWLLKRLGVFGDALVISLGVFCALKIVFAL